jgi:hypothetical protein
LTPIRDSSSDVLSYISNGQMLSRFLSDLILFIWCPSTFQVSLQSGR